MSHPLSIAIDLARNGYYVHPLAARDKVPLAEHGSNDATRDEQTIRAWWHRWPDANVGISLDKTGLVDIAPDGPEWAARFKANGMPRTTLYTSGGGAGHWHALYRLPLGGPIARINVSKQYDVMSQGNAVAPGSIHPSGRAYTAVTPVLAVKNLPIAPAWAIALLTDKQARSATPPSDSAEWGALPPGATLAQSRRFLALCKKNDQLRAVCAGEPVILTTKSGGKDSSTSIQRSVFVNQLIRAKYPHAEIRALALHFSGVLESNPRHFEQDIDRLLFKYTPKDYAPESTGVLVATPAVPRGGRRYEITASDMLDRYHEHADCGPAGIILDWTIDDAAERLGVSTGTIKRREAELTEAGHIRREYGRVILEPAEIRSQPIVVRQTASIATPMPSQATDQVPIGSQPPISQPNAENPREIPVCIERAHDEVTHSPTEAPPPSHEPAAVAAAPAGALGLGKCVLSAPAGARTPRDLAQAVRWAILAIEQPEALDTKSGELFHYRANPDRARAWLAAQYPTLDTVEIEAVYPAVRKALQNEAQAAKNKAFWDGERARIGALEDEPLITALWGCASRMQAAERKNPGSAWAKRCRALFNIHDDIRRRRGLSAGEAPPPARSRAGRKAAKARMQALGDALNTAAARADDTAPAQLGFGNVAEDVSWLRPALPDKPRRGQPFPYVMRASVSVESPQVDYAKIAADIADSLRARQAAQGVA